MKVSIDDEELRLMKQALEQTDTLVTSVIKGVPSTRYALDVARTLSDLKRRRRNLKSQEKQKGT